MSEKKKNIPDQKILLYLNIRGRSNILICNERGYSSVDVTSTISFVAYTGIQMSTILKKKSLLCS